MPQQSYNFFGLGPAQQQASQDPALLAQQMALQEYNNPTSSQTSGSQGGGMDMSALAKMMMSQNAPGSKGAADAYMNANAVPGSVVTSPNTSLPWLSQGPSAWSGS